VAIEITAAVVEAQDKPFELQMLEIDEPGPGEVLVRLIATGVCHTDGHDRRAACSDRIDLRSARRLCAGVHWRHRDRQASG